MSSKKSLVTNKDKIVKVGNNDMRTEPNMAKESITPSISKKKIDTVNKTDKTKASKKMKSISNKSDIGKLLDKSRSAQITET